jgi:hypothetical protein
MVPNPQSNCTLALITAAKKFYSTGNKLETSSIIKHHSLLHNVIQTTKRVGNIASRGVNATELFMAVVYEWVK